MCRPSAGSLAGSAQHTKSVGEAASARITLDTHIQAIAAAAAKPTPEQADRLRALLPAPDNAVGRTSDLHVFVAGVLVSLAGIGLTGFMVVRLGGTTPAGTPQCSRRLPPSWRLYRRSSRRCGATEPCARSCP